MEQRIQARRARQAAAHPELAVVIPSTPEWPDPPRPARPDGLAELPLSGRAGGKAELLRVSLSHRWAVTGTTGSGKTTFTKALIRRLRKLWPHASVYVLDSKKAGDFDTWPGIVTGDHVPEPIRSAGGGVQVWQPDIGDMGAYDSWFRRILGAHDRTRPAILMIDELSSVAPNRERSPDGLTLLYKQGRGKAVSVVTLTQGVIDIPRNVLDQTTHLVRFRLQNDYDARRADRLLWRDGRPREPEAAHGFNYRRLDIPSVAPLQFDDAREMLSA